MTPMRVIRTILLAVAVALVAAPAGADDANPAASAFMQSLATSAIKQLTDPAVSQVERRARFHALLDEHFDMGAIAKFTLGRYWRTATDEQRAEFRQLFEDFLVQSYSTRFAEYRGQGFEVVGSTAGSSGIIVVHSKVHLPSSEDVRVDWHLHTAGSSFTIIDIVVEGVSMAVTQRSEFASVIQSRGGIDGLLDALRAKNAQSADSSAGQ
jgi:phospholipid transport system substrate-binding protein